MSNKGWIKLHRQIQDSALWDDGSPFDKAHAWIDLLLCVNHADREKMVRGEIVKIRQGEIFTSDNFLANRWHWSRNRVRRHLDVLERNNMVTVKRTADGTYINVVNYAKYQLGRTTNGTGNGTTDGTSDGTTDGTQYKNYKNDKNTNNTLSAPPEESPAPTLKQISDYCKKRGSAVDPDEFFDYFQVRNWTKAKGLKITVKNYQAEIRNWERRRSTRTETEQEMRRQYDEWTV